jgi:hypothetical protein
MPRTSTKAATGVEPAYRLEDQVGFLLRRAYQRVSSNLIERIGPSDLTAPQFATLARLYERGTLSQNLLGRLVAMEPANIRARPGGWKAGPCQFDSRRLVAR